MRRLARQATGFGALHIVHTALNLVFTLAQLLVLARGLDSVRYSEVVFLTAVGLYLQPIDQAIGRANYVGLRADALGGPAGPRGEVVWLLYMQAILLTAMSFAVPVWFGTDDPLRYLGNALFLFGCLFTNYWSFDLQSTVWSADLGRAFALISIVRRILFLLALVLFWVTGDFLLFGVATTLVILVFMGILARLVARSSPLRLRPDSCLADRDCRPSQAVLELVAVHPVRTLVLNSPYAVLTALFGVGPVLVVFDTVMKVCRLAMAGTRTLAEIFLPRISRQLVAGDTAGARRGLLLVTATSLAATAIPAAAVLFFSPFVFNLLLGPNNVVPAEAAPAAALIVLTSGIYQPAAFFLSYLNAKAAIRRITGLALAGVVVYAAALSFLGAQAAVSLWIYAIFFGTLSIGAVLFSATIGAKNTLQNDTTG